MSIGVVAQPTGFQFPEPVFAQRLFHGLEEVVEIGGSYHNPYHSVSRFVGRYRNIAWDPNEDFKRYDLAFCGHALPIDIEAEATALPLDDNSVDALIASHVIEHVWDPIKALAEWLRVVRPGTEGYHGQRGQPTPHGGYVYLVVPHKMRMPDERGDDRLAAATSEFQLLGRYRGTIPPPANYPANTSVHRSFWTSDSFARLLDVVNRAPWFPHTFAIEAMMERDDTVSNGMVFVLRKEPA